MPRIDQLFAIGLTLALLAPGGTRRADPDAGCSPPEFRAFDFWLGEWAVRDSTGEELGHNSIRRTAGGCALLESWTSAAGSTGASLNFYDPQAGAWTRVWVGASGVRLHLTGGRLGEAMVLQGERVRDGEAIRDRISWAPAEGGTVVQRWEVSADEGATWEEAWRGTYHPLDEPAPPGSPAPGVRTTAPESFPRGSPSHASPEESPR